MFSTIQRAISQLADALRREHALEARDVNEFIAFLIGAAIGFLVGRRGHMRDGRPRVIFTVGQISGEHMAAIVKATDPPKTLRVKFKDAEGNDATVDGVPEWGISDPALGTLTPSSDGLSCEFNPGSPSVGQINVKADADLGQGVVDVIGTLDVEVIPGDAVTAEISIE